MLPVPYCWRHSASFAETVASFSVSASSYCFSKHIFVVAVVVPELKFREIQRQISTADAMIGTNDAALQQRPEGIKVLSMNESSDVLPFGVLHGVMRIYAMQALVARELIGSHQRYSVAHRLVYERLKCIAAEILDYPANDTPLAANSSDHAGFTG